MKRIIAVLTALAMLLTLTAALAEEETAPAYEDEHPGVLAYSSVWVSEDMSTWAEIGCLYDGMEALLVRMTGEDTFTSWEYLPLFDDETGSLKADNGMKADNTAEGEMITDSEYAYEDGVATFSLDEQGHLIWADEKEDAGAGLEFIKIGNFVGDYVCDRASISIRWTGERYAVDVEWGDSAEVTYNWVMGGDYSAADDTLPVQGLCQKLTFLENGEIDPEADTEEKEVSAVFSFNDDGFLIWTSPDGQADGMLFESLWTPIWQWDD